MRLLNAEDMAGLRLRQLAVLDGPVNLQDQLGLERFLFGIGEAKIREYVAAALGMLTGWAFGPVLFAISVLPFSGVPLRGRQPPWNEFSILVRSTYALLRFLPKRVQDINYVAQAAV